MLYFERRYDAALKEYRRTLKLDPNYGITRFFLGQAYAQKEMYPEAIQELKRALNLDPGSPEKIAALGYVCAMAGQRDEARKRIEELNELATQRYVSPVQIAQIHAGLDEPDQALDCLEKAYQDRDTYLVWLKIRPVFDSIRFDSRFDRLCEKIGLPE